MIYVMWNHPHIHITTNKTLNLIVFWHVLNVPSLYSNKCIVGQKTSTLMLFSLCCCIWDTGWKSAV